MKETLAIIKRLPDLDLFLSSARRKKCSTCTSRTSVLREGTRIYKDRTASSAPVGNFYYGVYHTLILGPATSNTVAKCVYGISDNTLATNVFAQAGKLPRAGDRLRLRHGPRDGYGSAEGHGEGLSAPHRLENTEKLKTFEDTTVVETIEEFERAIDARQKWLNGSSSDRPSGRAAPHRDDPRDRGSTRGVGTSATSASRSPP